MIIKISNYSRIISDYYGLINGYDIKKDPNLTYKEFVFITNVSKAMKLGFKYIDTNEFVLFLDYWNQYEASKTQIVILDGNWDNFLIDRVSSFKREV